MPHDVHTPDPAEHQHSVVREWQSEHWLPGKWHDVLHIMSFSPHDDRSLQGWRLETSVTLRPPAIVTDVVLHVSIIKKTYVCQRFCFLALKTIKNRLQQNACLQNMYRIVRVKIVRTWKSFVSAKSFSMCYIGVVCTLLRRMEPNKCRDECVIILFRTWDI